jgi:hypothetical protein
MAPKGKLLGFGDTCSMQNNAILATRTNVTKVCRPTSALHIQTFGTRPLNSTLPLLAKPPYIHPLSLSDYNKKAK